MKNNWFVITGGPSSGKTTTVELLALKGLKTTEESARKYFEQESKKGLGVNEIRDNIRVWQDSISKLQIELERSLNPDHTIFFDRALPDALGYYDFLKLEAPDFYKSVYKKSFYKKVFFLEPLPVVADGVRIESDEDSKKISDAIYRSYLSLSVEIINVPVMDKIARVEHILEKVNIVNR